MLTFWTLVMVLVLLVLGIIGSIACAIRYSAPAMGFLAFLLFCMACEVTTRVITVAAQLDNIKIQ